MLRDRDSAVMRISGLPRLPSKFNTAQGSDGLRCANAVLPAVGILPHPHDARAPFRVMMVLAPAAKVGHRWATKARLIPYESLASSSPM